MNIFCLMHVPFEDAANIGVWAATRGHPFNFTRLYDGETLPPLDTFDMLTIMGGPMNIYEYDAYPWLMPEKTFIQQAIDAEKKVIGVCLGAQLIADVLGANVIGNREKEIGWHPIALTEAGQASAVFAGLPKVMDVFQWHGDTFSTPPGGIHLATSSACENQAFLFEQNVLGLQFHLEYSQESIEKMLTHCADEIVPGPYINTVDRIREKYDKIPATAEWLYTLLDNFASI